MNKIYALLACLCFLHISSSFAQAPDENRFVKTVLAEKLDEPMMMTFLPDGRILLAERKGDVKQFDPKTNQTKVLAHINVNTKYTNRIGTVREAEEGLQGIILDPNFKENHFVFLIDVSGSMAGADRLPLLQKSIIELTNLMRPEDKITIITYADKVLVQLQPTSGSEKQKIIGVIQSLIAKGNTAGTRALQEAYVYAQSHFIRGGVNQIILSTDGGFDGLNESQDKLEKLVKKKAKKDIKLSVLAFGNNKSGKKIMEKFSVMGKGFYLFLANENEAKIKLVEVVKNIARR